MLLLLGLLLMLLVGEHMLLQLIGIGGRRVQWHLKPNVAVTIFLTDSSSGEEIVTHLWRLLQLLLRL